METKAFYLKYYFYFLKKYKNIIIFKITILYIIIFWYFLIKQLNWSKNYQNLHAIKKGKIFCI